VKRRLLSPAMLRGLEVVAAWSIPEAARRPRTSNETHFGNGTVHARIAGRLAEAGYVRESCWNGSSFELELTDAGRELARLEGLCS